MIVRQISQCSNSRRGIGHDSGTLPDPRFLNASAHFMERAKYYRFAAARTENAQEIERLCDVAFMFERMAHDVRRLRQAQSRFPVGKAGSPPADAGKTTDWSIASDRQPRISRFIKIWRNLARFIRCHSR
jgi:hypothetical protein